MGSLRGMQGAGDVARALSGGARGATLALVEGVAGFVWAPGGELRGVVTFALRDERIAEIAVTGDAARIADLDIVTLDA
jgi:RNA polymerase sigma-70 factor (ECF subfamily)